MQILLEEQVEMEDRMREPTREQQNFKRAIRKGKKEIETSRFNEE